VSGKVIDRDRGYKTLQACLAVLKQQNPSVVVGVLGPKATAVHKNSDKGETVAQIAASHELGIGVPERSFLRRTADENRAAYMTAIKNGLRATLQYNMKARKIWNPLKSVALRRVALKVEGDVKKRIADGITPPNARSTIRKKGSSKPLIDSGQLRASITSAVRSGDSDEGGEGTP
jgi:hypothetical protein